MARKRIFMIYKQHAVCFRCRVALKDITECPHCRQPMMNAPASLEVPRKHQIQSWKRLAQVYKGKSSPKLNRTHNAEYEYNLQLEFKKWRPGVEVIFSRKLTPHKKKSK